MKYTIEALQELIGEEILVKIFSEETLIRGVVQDVIIESNLLLLDVKSIEVDEIEEIFQFDEDGTPYLVEEEDGLQTGVYSDEQFEALIGEYVIITKIEDDVEHTIEGVVSSVDIEEQILYLDGNFDPIDLAEIIVIKVKDANGLEIELAPDNYLSAFGNEEQYLPEQFISLKRQFLRFTYIDTENETEIAVKGQLILVDLEEGGTLELKEHANVKYFIPNILDCFLITNNGDEQYILPAYQPSVEQAEFLNQLSDGGNYPPDFLNIFLNMEIKIRGDFGDHAELQGKLLKIDDNLVYLENIVSEIYTDNIDSLFIKQNTGEWNFVSSLSFDHRNMQIGTYDKVQLEKLINKSVALAYLLNDDGIVEIPGVIAKIENDCIYLNGFEQAFLIARIYDIFFTNKTGIASFILPTSCEAEPATDIKFSHNELLALLMRRVRLEGLFGDLQRLEGMILKCYYNKGYLVLAEFPNLAIPFSSIKSYSLVSN